MKPETKTVLETLIKREADEFEIKMFEILTEMGMYREKQHPVEFSLDFGKRCFEMGKSYKKCKHNYQGDPGKCPRCAHES